MNCNQWPFDKVAIVSDLLKDDGTFFTLEEFQQKYHVNVQFLQYYGCVNAVKAYIRKQDIQILTKGTNPRSKLNQMYWHSPKGCKIFYEKLLSETEVSNACKNWEKLLKKEINWTQIFTLIHKTKEIKLKWFQMKICYRVLVTNSVLLSMKVTDTNLCNFCSTEKDTIYHYLWQCTHVQSFWNDFVNLFKEKCLNCTRLCVTDMLVLFGVDNTIKTDVGFDFILLHAKFFIYKCRLNKTKPRLQTFLQQLKHIYVIDEYVSKMEMSYDKFLLKWLPYTVLVE